VAKPIILHQQFHYTADEMASSPRLLLLLAAAAVFLFSSAAAIHTGRAGGLGAAAAVDGGDATKVGFSARQLIPSV
jgi:hypothetical protein